MISDITATILPVLNDYLKIDCINNTPVVLLVLLI